MKTSPTILYRLANLVSIVGHPLLTLSLFSVYVSFWQLPFRQAVLLSCLLIGGVIVPVCIRNYQKVRQGVYTNFDVSDQRQRAGFYPVLIGLVALTTGLFVATGQPRSFCYGMGFSFLLLVVSYGVNYFIKTSLHTSLSFFLAWAGGLISQPLGITMGVLAVLIAVSRLILKRHTLLEVLVGALIGLTVGIGFYLLV